MYHLLLAMLLIPLIIGCATQEPDVPPLASDSTASIADPVPDGQAVDPVTATASTEPAYPGPDRATPHTATATASPEPAYPGSNGAYPHPATATASTAPAEPSPTPATQSTTTPLAGEDMDAGDPSPPPQANSTPAEPAPIHWKTVATKQGKLKELVGISGSVMVRDPSPDGRWRLVSVVPEKERSEGGPPDASLYVLDSEADDHWLAAEVTGVWSWSFAWTEDGRLLWIDFAGAQRPSDMTPLYIANSDGSHRRNLEAPEPARNVWYGGASTAFVAGEERFWRVDLEAATWDPVLDSGGQPLAVPNFTDRVTASPDGTFATLINTKGDIYRIPLAAGEPAVQVASFEIETWATDAMIGSVVPLANSPLWASGHRRRGDDAVFVDSTTGEFIPVTKFPPQGSPGGHPTVSPDGRWFAINKQTSATSAPDDRVLYIASSTDPYGGRVIDARRLVGWTPKADLALLITNERDLVRLDLQTGSTQRLLEREFVPEYLENVIFDGNETIFVIGKEAAHAFTLEGHKRGELEALAPISLERAAARGALLFVTQVEDDGAAESSIWLWEPAP